MMVVTVHQLDEAPHLFAQRLIQDHAGLAAATALGLRLLAHAAEPPAMHRVHPPGGLREHAGQMRVVGALKDAAGHMSQVRGGQDDQPSQLGLEMATLALVGTPVAKDHRVRRDDGCWGNNRPFHHRPPWPDLRSQRGPRVPCRP